GLHDFAGGPDGAQDGGVRGPLRQSETGRRHTACPSVNRWGVNRCAATVLLCVFPAMVDAQSSGAAAKLPQAAQAAPETPGTSGGQPNADAKKDKHVRGSA